MLSRIARQLFNVLLAIILLVTSSTITLGTFSNDNTQLFVSDRHVVSPVDWQTWCGDCVGTDYTTGSPWTINPGWVNGYTPPIIGNDSQTGGEKTPGCLWDSDDEFNYTTQGNVFPANTTLTATECRWRGTGIFNHGGVSNYIKFSSSSADLIIKIKWDWGANSYTYTVGAPTKNRDTRLWEYKACVRNPHALDGVSISVPGSHDGAGIWEVITITLTNPGSKAMKSGGIFGAGNLTPNLWCNGTYTQLYNTR